MEILCSIVQDVLCDRGKSFVKTLQESVSACISTDEAVKILKEAGCAELVMSEMTARIQSYMSEWAGKAVQVEAIVFSNVHGILGKTSDAEKFIDYMKGAIHG